MRMSIELDQSLGVPFFMNSTVQKVNENVDTCILIGENM